MAAARRNGRYIDRATAVQLVTERVFPGYAPRHRALANSPAS